MDDQEPDRVSGALRCVTSGHLLSGLWASIQPHALAAEALPAELSSAGAPGAA